jgi:hypothetical protein
MASSRSFVVPKIATELAAANIKSAFRLAKNVTLAVTMQLKMGAHASGVWFVASRRKHRPTIFALTKT